MPKVLLLSKHPIQAFVCTTFSAWKFLKYTVFIPVDFIVYFFRILAHDYPDIEIVVGAGGLSGDLSGAMRTMVGITDEFFQTVFKDIIGKV